MTKIKSFTYLTFVDTLGRFNKYGGLQSFARFCDFLTSYDLGVWDVCQICPAYRTLQQQKSNLLLAKPRDAKTYELMNNVCVNFFLVKSKTKFTPIFVALIYTYQSFFAHSSPILHPFYAVLSHIQLCHNLCSFSGKIIFALTLFV